MKQRTWRIGADVAPQTRALILRVHPPRLADVFVRTITWAYGVEESFPFDDVEQECTLTGLYRGTDTEAFSLRIGSATHWPDGSGQPLFLALSCAHKVPPFSAGTFDPADAVPIAPIRFAVRLQLLPTFQFKPRSNPAVQPDAA